MVRSTLLGTTLTRKRDLSLKTHLSIDPKTSEGSVSYNSILKINHLLILIADKPFMEPRKDYDDYSRFINDTYLEEKTEMLNQSLEFEDKRKSYGATKM